MVPAKLVRCYENAKPSKKNHCKVKDLIYEMELEYSLLSLNIDFRIKKIEMGRDVEKAESEEDLEKKRKEKDEEVKAAKKRQVNKETTE